MERESEKSQELDGFEWWIDRGMQAHEGQSHGLCLEWVDLCGLDCASFPA